MTQTGLEVFDKSIQTTNIWLDELMEEIGPDRHRAYHALMAVLHALRDRLTVEESAHLAAQLPILVRGLYYHSWKPAEQPKKVRTADDFLSRVQHDLRGASPTGADDAVRAVFSVLDRHISGGEIEDVKSQLPADIRRLWPRHSERH